MFRTGEFQNNLWKPDKKSDKNKSSYFELIGENTCWSEKKPVSHFKFQILAMNCIYLNYGLLIWRIQRKSLERLQLIYGQNLVKTHLRVMDCQRVWRCNRLSDTMYLVLSTYRLSFNTVLQIRERWVKFRKVCDSNKTKAAKNVWVYSAVSTTNR